MALAFLPSGGEVVLGLVEDLFAENFARLLSDALAQVLIVHLHAGHVPGVARDDGGLPGRRAPLHTSETQSVSWSEDYQGIVIISASLAVFRGVSGPNNAPGTYLGIHVVVRRAVEVGVRPLGEGVLAELLGGAVVLEGKLSVGLEELGLLHLRLCVFTNLTIDLFAQLPFIFNKMNEVSLPWPAPPLTPQSQSL